MFKLRPSDGPSDATSFVNVEVNTETYHRTQRGESTGILTFAPSCAPSGPVVVDGHTAQSSLH